MKDKWPQSSSLYTIFTAGFFLLFPLDETYAAVFDPKGPIAAAEWNLIKTAVFLMLIIVVPTLIAFFTVARKYRAGNPNAEYDPDRAHSPWKELILWVLPAIIVAILATITWGATHALDPYKPIASDVKPIKIQVVALRWKWLFLYPEQGIATLNFFEFPAGTPLAFQLTADNAPMNSFWVPELGGQRYAMEGMTTQTHFMADGPGEFRGGAAEINGEGFADMKFTAKSVAAADFDAWVASVKKTSPPLDDAAYEKLAEPSQDLPEAAYSSISNDLYNSIVMKYMMPMSSSSMPAMMDTMHMTTGTLNTAKTMSGMHMQP